MPTANTIITDALGLIGVTDPTDSVAAEDAALGLRVLIRRINSLGIEPSTAQVVTFQAVTLVDGDSSKTIGTGGDVNVTCPVRIETGAYLRSGTTDYPLDVIGREPWADISNKTDSGIPRAVYFEPISATQARLNFWPASDGSYTAYLPLMQRVGPFSDLTTNVSLSDGYEELLVTDLAVALAPFYNREAPGSVIQRARVAKRQIKRMKTEIPELDTSELQHAVTGSWYATGSILDS